MSDTIIINEIAPNETSIVVNSQSAVATVNNRFGAVILTKNDVGLSAVDNTSDLNKPVSYATSSALNSIQTSLFGTFSYIEPLSSNWNDAYTNLVSNSASYIYEDIYANITFKTIQDFASSNPQHIYKGYNITLHNGRVYTFAGNDASNPSNYLEINSNPINPIYQEIVLNQNQTLIDVFALSDFKTAKYTLQVETTYSNDIYYSEINLVASIGTQLAVVNEYGQNLLMEYFRVTFIIEPAIVKSIISQPNFNIHLIN